MRSTHNLPKNGVADTVITCIPVVMDTNTWFNLDESDIKTQVEYHFLAWRQTLRDPRHAGERAWANRQKRQRALLRKQVIRDMNERHVLQATLQDKS